MARIQDEQRNLNDWTAWFNQRIRSASGFLVYFDLIFYYDAFQDFRSVHFAGEKRFSPLNNTRTGLQSRYFILNSCFHNLSVPAAVIYGSKP